MPVTSGIPDDDAAHRIERQAVGRLSTPKVIGVEPVAVTVKLRNAPCRPATLVGLVMVGGTSTLKAATELVIEPTVLEITTL